METPRIDYRDITPDELRAWVRRLGRADCPPLPAGYTPETLAGASPLGELGDWQLAVRLQGLAAVAAVEALAATTGTRHGALALLLQNLTAAQQRTSRAVEGAERSARLRLDELAVAVERFRATLFPDSPQDVGWQWSNLWKAFTLAPGTARARIALTAWELFGLCGSVAAGALLGWWGLLAPAAFFVLHEVAFARYAARVAGIAVADGGDVVGEFPKADYTFERYLGRVR